MLKKLAPVAALMLGGSVHADFDGSEPLLCTLMTANICDYGGCQATTREAGLNGVHHLVVDFERDRVKSPETDLQANISAVETVDNMLFLGGVNERAGVDEDDARSWTMAIAHPTGTMTLSVSGEGVAMTVFGACTPVDD